MSRLLYRLGGFSGRNRRFVLLAWILIALGVTVGRGRHQGRRPSEDFSMPGTEAQTAVDLLQDA